MTRRQITAQYQRLNSEDRSTFQGWLIANTVVGALILFALIAGAFVYSGDGSNTATVQTEKVASHEAH
jgi:hypothetical protein